jgi:exodeoxyribonuclease-3
LQETKATEEVVEVKLLEELGFTHHWFSAQKKGYSGVAVFSTIKPDKVKLGTGHEISDFEGRVIELQFGKIKLVNAYFPSGTTGGVRQDYKYVWLDEFYDYMQALRKRNPEVIVCGDYNVAHEEIDLHSPKTNQKTSGFLPEERAWMTKWFENGWIDSFRYFNKEPHNYTWWTMRFPSVRLENKGWRIDYISVSKALEKQLISAAIFPEIKFSDHCPIFLEIKE